MVGQREQVKSVIAFNIPILNHLAAQLLRGSIIEIVLQKQKTIITEVLADMYTTSLFLTVNFFFFLI